MYVALIVLGIAASVIGSIVGLGGGFIAVPILRLFFHFAPGAAAGASLIFVFANAVSASARFASQRRIAFDIAVPMALGAIPTSIAGAFWSARVSASTFDAIFAVVLSLVAIDILRRAFAKDSVCAPAAPQAPPSLWIVIPAGLIVGLVSSLFGIGGGIIVVPVLLYATARPLHVVTATSTAVIAMTAPAGILTQFIQHDVSIGASIALAAGGLVGGQAGALVAGRISPRGLGLVLAVSMVLAAGAMIVKHTF